MHSPELKLLVCCRINLMCFDAGRFLTFARIGKYFCRQGYFNKYCYLVPVDSVIFCLLFEAYLTATDKIV